MDTRMRSGQSSLGPLSVLAIIGFCGYIFWELLGIFGNLAFAARFVSKETAQLLGIFEFFVLSAAFIFAGRFHRKLEQRFKEVIAIGIASTFVTLLTSLVAYIAPNDSLPIFFWLILWGSHGLSLAGLMFAWVLFFSKFFCGSTSRILSIGYVLGYCLFCLYSLANPNENGAMPLLIAAIAAALTITLLVSCNFSSSISDEPDTDDWQNTCAEKDGEITESDQSRWPLKRFKLPRVFYASSFGLSFGFAIYLINYLGSFAVTLGAIGGLSGCIIAFVLLPKNILTSDSAVRRLSFIPVAMPLLLLPTGGPITCIVCCMLIIASSTFTAVTSWVSTVSEGSSETKAIKLFSESKWPGWLGFFLGMTIGRFVVLGDAKAFTTSIALIAILVCVGFAWYELSAFSGNSNSNIDSGKGKEVPPPQDCFTGRCDEIAATNKLTPRETEVLHLLAKGYNADSISKELNIAKPTTKTHIQHIYQKLTINSQQALIALINDKS